MANGSPHQPNSVALPPPKNGKRNKKNKANDPDTDENTPEKPYGLIGAASEIWDDVVSELQKLKVLHRVDKNQVAVYCNNVARARQMQEYVDKNGYTYLSKGRFGEMERIRPQVHILQDAEKQIRAFAQEWGMSAAARSRLKGNAEQGDLFDEHDPTAGY